MVDSDWVDGESVVIGDHRALVLDLELPVEPDRGGQGEQALADADEDPAEDAATVLFQAELLLEGVDDRLDPLAHPAQGPNRRGSSVRSGADQEGPQPCDMALERLAGQALVGQDDRARG